MLLLYFCVAHRAIPCHSMPFFYICHFTQMQGSWAPNISKHKRAQKNVGVSGARQGPEANIKGFGRFDAML